MRCTTENQEMSKKIRNLTLYLIVSLLVCFLLFSLLKINSLQEQLVHQKEQEMDFKKALEAQMELLPIDSMLVDGEDYTGALLAYQSKFENTGADTDQLRWRMAVTEKLAHLKSHESDFLVHEEENDPISSEIPSDKLLQKEDSLQFALEKAKLQLSRVKRKLQRKSFGEYLTFSTQKGNELHYVGGVKHGKANGFGFALLNSGSRYQGEWKNNKRHGFGTFYWSDGQYYEGEYVDDQRNGQGTYNWPNGDKYVGDWKDDQRCGKGIFYDQDGNTIAEGVWKADKLVEKTKVKNEQTNFLASASL